MLVRLLLMPSLAGWFLASCNQEPAFHDIEHRKGQEGGVLADGPSGESDDSTPQSPNGPSSGSERTETLDPGDSRFIQEVRTSASQTVNVDSFWLGELLEVSEHTDNSKEPVKTHTITQSLGSPRSFPTTVTGPGSFTAGLQKKAPQPSSHPHAITHVGKPLDLFVTVDDSESFSQAAQQRTRQALTQLITDLQDTSWVLYLGGLEGVGGYYDRFTIVRTGTLATDLNAIQNALNQIFLQGSLGDERVFRSLNRLTWDSSGIDRDYAMRAYLIITDAPNCKNNNNTDSSVCNRNTGSDDNALFLMTSNTSTAAYMKHGSVFGSFYRQTNNTAVCSDVDDVEVPNSNESLALNSQYAHLALTWENLIKGNSVSTPSWVGDLCSAAEDFTWLTAYAQDIKTVLARRFRLPTSPSPFPPELNSLNLHIFQGANALAQSDYTFIDGRFVVLGAAPTGSLEARWHHANDYDRVSFPNIFALVPKPGTVRLEWINGGMAACASAASFDTLDPQTPCRHWGRDLFWRNPGFLPSLVPGNAPLNVTLYYENLVTEVRDLVATASSAILPDTASVAGYPSGASATVAAMTRTISSDGRTVTFHSNTPLPPGSYLIELHEHSQTIMSASLPTSVATRSNPVLCYLPGVAESAGWREAQMALAVDPPTAQYPCTWNTSNQRVEVEGRIPINPKTNARDLAVIYLGFVEALQTFPLRYPPDGNRMRSVRITRPQGTSSIGTDDYSVQGNNLILRNRLLPGEKIEFTYDFRPPLSACYPLRGVAAKDHDYTVWYGPSRKEEKMAPACYKIMPDAGPSQMQVCVEGCPLEIGNRVVVGYVVSEG